MSEDNKQPEKKSFWHTLLKSEMIVQIVWAIVIGAVSITAIIVYGTK